MFGKTQIYVLIKAILTMISIQNELSFLNLKLNNTKNPHESFEFHKLRSNFMLIQINQYKSRHNP
jgi:hypothetical protein